MSGISNHFDSMAAIQTIITGLSLTGLTGGVVIQEVANYQDKKVTLPVVSISPYGPEVISDQNNYQDGVDYPILVAIIGNKDITALEQRLAWRQKMRRNLYNRNLSSVVNSYSYSLSLKPGNVIEPKAWFDKDAFISGFIVMAQFQEPRT